MKSYIEPNNYFNVKEKEKVKIKQILNAYKRDTNNLISILQEIQEFYGYLPRNIIFYLSKKLKLSAAEIYGVATFYTQFKFHESGKYLIVCCDGTACHVKSAPLILQFIENHLGIRPGETTKDKLFSLESVACLGCCAISPVCIINGQIYGNVTTNRIKKVLNGLKNKNINY